MDRRFAFVLAALIACAGLAQGQLREDRGAPMGRFDFYVLALSWSATWCAITGERRGSSQCESGRNPGFVVHGLWPQYESGYPAFCAPDGRNPSRNALQRAEGVLPEIGLARHQWRKHGTCSGLSAEAYFEATATAKAKVRIPAELAAPRANQRFTVLEVERAFAEANPGLRPEMMSVTCDRGMMEEVRICLTRDLRGFRACPEVDRDVCRARDFNVPSAR
jgi:ribonuclease T2